jgi:hypothetical protein
MNLEDLHDREDNFEVFYDQKKSPQIPKETVKEENFGYTSARRAALFNDNDSLDEKWSKYGI